MGQLDGKIGIITGAASGIGAACARVLSREGAKLVLTDLDDAAGQRLAAEVGGIYLHHDVTDEAGWPAVVAAAERLGGLHILVANAGIGIMGSAIDMSLADWRRQMAVNVDGVFLTVKYGVPLMRRSGGGSVVMMSSVAGITRVGEPGRLQRDQGRGAAVRQVDRAGVRRRARQHPGELGASRRHRYADLDQAAAGRERSARSEQDRRGDGADRQGRPGGGHCQWRAVPVLGRVEPHDRIGIGDRWGDDSGAGGTVGWVG